MEPHLITDPKILDVLKELVRQEPIFHLIQQNLQPI